MESKNLLISGSILFSSLIIGSASLVSLYTDKANVLELENGKIRLGKVYEERLNTEIEVVSKVDNSVLLTMSSPTKDIFKKSDEYMRAQIEQVNKSGGFPDKDGKKKKLDYSEVFWTSDVVFKKHTTVTYRSEYSNSFVLTIDATEESIPAGSKTVDKALQSLQFYSQQMLTEYETKNSFIK